MKKPSLFFFLGSTTLPPGRVRDVGHPAQPTAQPQGPTPVSLSLRTFVQLSLTVQPKDFYRHPPAPPKGPEPIWPNLNTRTFVQLSLTIQPKDFNRHPPAPPKGPEFLFPNLILGQSVTVNPFFYREFQHPPAQIDGPEFKFPNLQLSTLAQPVGESMLHDAPPVVRGHPDWLAPNLQLSALASPVGKTSLGDAPLLWRHTPEPIFPNLVLLEMGLLNRAFTPQPTYPRAPDPRHPPEFKFPNLHISTFSIPVGRALLVDAPRSVHGNRDWLPPNLLLPFFYPPTEFDFTVTPGAYTFTGSPVQYSVGNRQRPGPRKVRDYWDRDEHGRFLPGSGYH